MRRYIPSQEYVGGHVGAGVGIVGVGGVDVNGVLGFMTLSKHVKKHYGGGLFMVDIRKFGT